MSASLPPLPNPLPPGEREKTPDDTTSGMRIGAEFASGPIVGAVMGYGLDRLFHSLPLCLILGLLLGFGAGMLNVYRLLNDIPEGIGIHKQKTKRDFKEKP